MATIYREEGFTTLETLVVLFLTAAIGIMAFPQFAEMDQTMQRFNARNTFLQDLKRAQAEAITIGCRGIFDIAAGGESYQFGCDYLPYDTDSPPVSDEITLQKFLPTDISIASSADIIFDSRGQSVDEAGIISNVDVDFQDSTGGSPDTYAAGTLLGTGLFEFDNPAEI